jgi:hypothetical protein
MSGAAGATGAAADAGAAADGEDDEASEGSDGTKSPFSKNAVFRRTWISGSLKAFLRISQPVLELPGSPPIGSSNCVTAGALCFRRPERV